jgi:hypothetical protein
MGIITTGTMPIRILKTCTTMKKSEKPTRAQRRRTSVGGARVMEFLSRLRLPRCRRLP